MTNREKSLDRRSFVRLGAATAAVTASGVSFAQENTESREKNEMRYRVLGKTGLKVSEICFGTYGFNNPALLTAAMDAGINFVSTCADYQDGAAEEAVGKAMAKIGKKRDELVLLTGTEIRPGTSKQAILDSIDRSLKRLQTDRVDIFRNHHIEDPERVKMEEQFEAYEEAKKAGKVHFWGMSSHGRQLQECLDAAIRDGRFHFFIGRYDFISYANQAEIFHRAAEKGIGTAVFKIRAGNQQKDFPDLEKEGLTLPQAATRWALSNPDVCSVCVAMTNFDQIKEYCGAVGKKLGQAEIEMLQRYADAVYDKYCRNCGICESACPDRVAVADINRYAMYFKYYGREKDSMKLYASIPREQTAFRCGDCAGNCDAACPYGRKVREGLIEAHRMLI
ncbi:MAG TPA: aldo/keto reductase [bacterium]|nr:aldo/keto reductase [bacterium]HQL63977.1 aldo/keto reductase [bacterium]